MNADNLNRAQALFLIDDVDPGDVSTFARCILIFDGRDEAALQAARRRWKGFKSAGLPVVRGTPQPSLGPDDRPPACPSPHDP